MKDFCNEKFNELHVSQHEYETIVKNNRLLSEKCEELEYSLHELSRSRQHEENDILVNSQNLCNLFFFYNRCFLFLFLIDGKVGSRIKRVQGKMGFC